MVEYNKINAKLSNLQVSKLKTVVQNNEGTTLRMNARVFNGHNLPHKLFLTQRQITKLRNNIENNLQTDIKLSKAQIKKIIMSGGALGSILGKLAGPLLKIATPLATKFLPVLGLSAAMSGIDGAIPKRIHGGGTTLVISNEELDDIMKIIQALEDSDILLKGISKTIKNDIKEQNGNGLGMILGTLGASLLGNLLSGKRLYRAGEGMYRAGEGIKKKALMPPHPLTNFEIQNYYKNEPRYNGVYSKDNLSKIKNGAYAINLDEYKDIGTHWIALYVKNNEVIYFDSFGVEYIPRGVKKAIGSKDIKTNIFRIQDYNSIMSGYFCIEFIDFMFAGKNLIDFTNSVSPYDFKKNDRIILNYFK